MENGSIADAVIANRGLNFANPYGYANQDSANFKGDGSAVKESIRGNRDIQLLESVNGSSTNQFLASQIRQHNDSIQRDISIGNNFLSDRIAAQSIDAKFANVTEKLSAAERLAFANHASIERTLAANKADTDRQLHTMELKQVECCCELRAGQAAILAKQDAASDASVAAAEIASLRNQLLFSQNSGPGNSGN